MDSRIIVGIARDKEARDAVALGAMLARALDAPLLLAGAYATVVGPAAYAYEAATRETIEQHLESVRTWVPEDLRVETRAVGSTSTTRALHVLAEHTDAAMVVLGPTHHGRVGRAVLGDHTLAMLQAGPCAVAVAPAEYAATGSDPSRVGVAYVPTPEGREALDAGVALAARLNGSLQILLAAPATAESERTLDDARNEAGDAVPVETVLLGGIDAAELLRVASAGLDLLVMGSRGYGPMHRVLAGSVSAEVVHASACPVIVVPRGARVLIGAPAGP